MVIIFTLAWCWVNEPGLELIKMFPSENSMEEKEFFLDHPMQFLHDGKFLFVLDQQEHGVHVFDSDDSYLRTIGRPGQGPGELFWPHNIALFQNQLLILDNTQKLHIFEKSGAFIRSIPLMNSLMRFAANSKGILGSSIDRMREHRYFYFDPAFKSSPLKEPGFIRDEDKPFFNMDHIMKVEGDLIYCLQRYDKGFRIFDNQGTVIQKGVLNGDPFFEPDYEELDIKWHFKFFDMFYDHWVCYYFDTNAVRFMVFNMEGKLVHRVRLPMPDQEPFLDPETVYAGDMIFAKEGEEDRLYLAVMLPSPILLKYAVRRDAFIPYDGKRSNP